MARVPVTRRSRVARRTPDRRAGRWCSPVALIAGGVAGLMAGIDATKDEANAGLVIFGVAGDPAGHRPVLPAGGTGAGPGRGSPAHRAAPGRARPGPLPGPGRARHWPPSASGSASPSRSSSPRPPPSTARTRATCPTVSSWSASMTQRGGDPGLAPGQAPAQLAGCEVGRRSDRNDARRPRCRRAECAPGPGRRGDQRRRDPATTGRPGQSRWATCTARSRRSTSPPPRRCDYAGVDPASVDAGAEVLSPAAGSPVLRRSLGTRHSRYRTQRRSTCPPTRPRRGRLSHRKRSSGTAGIQCPKLAGRGTRPSDQRSARRSSGAGGRRRSDVEARRGQEGLSQLRSAATARGLLLALGIVAMTVGLVRCEAAATCARSPPSEPPSQTRRTVTGVTAGALALARRTARHRRSLRRHRPPATPTTSKPSAGAGAEPVGHRRRPPGHSPPRPQHGCSPAGNRPALARTLPISSAGPRSR